ncbi:MAG: hypothetical protein HRU09_13705 [Oligoflexales bacterium]|nr:hypothetical protein [Oligoflexales bacterium]
MGSIEGPESKQEATAEGSNPDNEGYDADSASAQTAGGADYDADSESQINGEFDGDTTANTGDTCVADELELQFPQEIQDCFDSNRIWDFNRSLCTPISGTCNDNCEYDELISAINSAGMGTPQKIESAIGRAKLITWGTKNNGNTIVAQWVYPPSGSTCTYDLQQGLPVTGCYRILPPNTPLLDKSDPAAVEAFVNACIDD